MGVTRLLLLGPFYTCRPKRTKHFDGECMGTAGLLVLIYFISRCSRGNMWQHISLLILSLDSCLFTNSSSVVLLVRLDSQVSRIWAPTSWAGPACQIPTDLQEIALIRPSQGGLSTCSNIQIFCSAFLLSHISKGHENQDFQLVRPHHVLTTETVTSKLQSLDRIMIFPSESI